jgi:hypothetical protein
MSVPKRKAKRKAKPKPPHRPPFEIDYTDVKRRAGMGWTETEIAYHIGFTPEGFRLRKGKDDLLQSALNSGIANGKASLRSKQYELAMDGDKTMLVWLGKNRLDQRDKSEVDQTSTVNVTVIKPEDL